MREVSVEPEMKKKTLILDLQLRALGVTVLIIPSLESLYLPAHQMKCKTELALFCWWHILK